MGLMQTIQLDFIGSPKLKIEEEQFNLWDDKGKPTKIRRDIDFAKVDELFNSFDSEEVERYKSYWESIKPKNDTELFQRWLFAFMSVHTGWEANVKGYESIKNWISWVNRDDELERRLVESRVGLHKNRTRFVSQFAQNFWSDPEWYKYQGGDWQMFRDRLVKNVLGLQPCLYNRF